MQRNNRLPPEAGKRLRSYDLPCLTFAEVVYPSDWRMPRHTHELAHFSLVLQGAYTERYGRRSREGLPSLLVLHPPAEDHEVTFHHTRTRIFTVIAKPQWLERVKDYTNVLRDPREFSAGPPVRLATRLYQEFKSMDEVAPLSMEGLALEVLAESSRARAEGAEGQRPRWLGRAEEFLREKFCERVTLDDIARAVGVHPVHLSRVFRSRHRCTVGDYVRRLQVDFAAAALSASDTPLHEIALAAGFSDQSHFSRNFKRLMGIPPAQYRKLHRAG